MSNEATQRSYPEAAAAARSRANMYSFLATLLNERPDAALVANLRSAGGDFISRLAEEASLTGLSAEGFRAMAKYVAECQSQPEDAVEQDLAVDWTRLFRGLSPAYSPMPPYEASFNATPGEEVDVIQDINNFYRAHGLMLNGDHDERPDYLGVELSFLDYLAQAEEQAWDDDDPGKAQSYQHATRTFISQHLATWADRFIEPALGFAKTGFYHGFLQLCRGVVAEAVA